MSTSAPAVELRSLTKSYGSSVALRSIDLTVERGEVFGYLGPNGAGKTTTIRLILASLQPSSGTAKVFGLDCHRETIQVHRQMAYVPGEADLWPSLTGEETLHLLGRLQGTADTAYRATLVHRFELDLTKKVRAYSKGNRQKLILIAALMCRPALLVLDEPTSGLDPLMEQVFRDCILEAKDLGQTVFLSSHILSEVEALCDRVAILRAGEIVQIGSLADLRHLSVLSVDLIVDGPPPDLAAVPGVTAVEFHDRRVTCQVSGSMEPLLAALHGTKVSRILSREPSLEEIFLRHYGAAPLAQG